MRLIKLFALIFYSNNSLFTTINRILFNFQLPIVRWCVWLWRSSSGISVKYFLDLSSIRVLNFSTLPYLWFHSVLFCFVFLINRIGASPQTYQCLTNKAVKYYMKESSAHIYNQRRRYDASKYNLHSLFWENTEIIIYMYLGFVKNYRFLIKKNWRVGKLRNDNNKAISHFAACVHHLVTTGHLGTTVHGYTPRCVVGRWQGPCCAGEDHMT